VTVWDFCRGADVAAAVALLSEARARGQRAAPRAPASTAAALAAALDAPPAGVALALDAAANCSSATRQTPLHAAVSCTYTLLITPAMHVQRIRVRARAWPSEGSCTVASRSRWCPPWSRMCFPRRRTHVPCASLLAPLHTASRHGPGEAAVGRAPSPNQARSCA